MNRVMMALAIASLVGCATTSGLDATVSQSGFDGATTVSVPVHGTACGSTSGSCLGMGAQWSTARPQVVLLNVALLMDYQPILSAKLSVDDTIVSLDEMQGMTQFSRIGDPVRTSTKYFAIPIGSLRRAVSANKVWLRVSTPSGTVEDRVIDGDVDSKAIHALRRFMAKVDAASVARN